MPIAVAPITTAGSPGDSGDVVGHGVGTCIVDVLVVVAKVTGRVVGVSSARFGTGVSLA